MRTLKWKKELLIRGCEVTLFTILRKGLTECHVTEGCKRSVRIAADSVVGFWDAEEKKYYIPSTDGWVTADLI